MRRASRYFEEHDDQVDVGLTVEPYIGKGQSTAPFVVAWKWQSVNDPRIVINETHLWIFGISWCENKSELPKLWKPSDWMCNME